MVKKKIRDNIGGVIWAIATFDSAAEVEEYCRRKLELTPKETAEAIEEARRRIKAAADFDLTAELGLALTRNNYLYKQAVKMQDLKTAAKTQRDRWILLGIDRPATGPAAAGSIIEYDADAAELEATIENVRGQLEALEIAPAGLALEDLTRAIVTRFLEFEKRLLCSPETAEQDIETQRSKRENS